MVSKRQIIICVSKDVEKLGPSYTAGRNVKWCSHCGKVWQFLKKLNTELPYDPAIPLLGIQPREMNTYEYQKNLYTSVHSSTIHTSQNRNNSNDERINEMWYIYTVEYYLTIKRMK